MWLLGSWAGLILPWPSVGFQGEKAAAWGLEVPVYLAAYWEWSHGWLCYCSVGRAQGSFLYLLFRVFASSPYLQLYLDWLGACLKSVVVWHLEQAFLGASSVPAVSACCVVAVPPKKCPPLPALGSALLCLSTALGVTLFSSPPGLW